jgi:DNA-binding FadR family transcriptional regulator
MALQRVVRRSVPDEVFEQLVSGVIAGDYAVGSALPSERELAEALGVSRPAVREALQRLAHAGVVSVRQGDGTTVRDIRQFGGLDLLPRLLLPRGTLDLAVARSILDARLRIAPMIATMAAERVQGAKRPDADALGRLDSALLALGATDGDRDRQLVALDFWDAVVELADSVVFRLMFNGLRAAYEPALDALAAVMAAEVTNTTGYARIADAIRHGRPRAAGTAATALLKPASDALLEALATLGSA